MMGDEKGSKCPSQEIPKTIKEHLDIEPLSPILPMSEHNFTMFLFLVIIKQDIEHTGEHHVKEQNHHPCNQVHLVLEVEAGWLEQLQKTGESQHQDIQLDQSN